MPETLNLHLQYYALFREQACKSQETLDLPVTNALELYAYLQTHYGFSLDAKLVKVSINENFAPLEQILKNGDRVVFIPPVAGG